MLETEVRNCCLLLPSSPLYHIQTLRFQLKSWPLQTLQQHSSALHPLFHQLQLEQLVNSASRQRQHQYVD